MSIVRAILVGIVLGILDARFLFVGSWLSLLPWTVAGLAIGWWSAWRRPVSAGLAYGFAVAFSFMIAGYSGAAPVASRLPGFTLLGLVGSACGAALAVLGSQARKRLAGSTRPR